MVSETIVKYGEPVLREKAQEVTEFNDEIRQIIKEMSVVLEESTGVGLAGPQVGLSLRLFVYKIDDDGPHALVNPRIIKQSGEEIMVEGCLSIPGLRGEVKRSARVTIIGLDENGEPIKMKAEGLYARMFQHETDHLDGILFIDKADPDTLETEPVDGEEEEEEII